MNEDIFHLGIKGLILNEQGNILLLKVNSKLLKKTKGYKGEVYWDIPGGRVKKDATCESTLKDEIKEELGISKIYKIKHLSIFMSNIRIPINNQQHVGLILSVYTCKIPRDSVIKLSEEHTEYNYFDPKTSAKLLSFKYPKEFTNIILNLEMK